MPERGQQSGRVVRWMVRADEVAFGDNLAAALGGIAEWTALAPGFEVGATHERLSEVLPEWGSGARLRLKSGGPILQYLQGPRSRPAARRRSTSEGSMRPRVNRRRVRLDSVDQVKIAWPGVSTLSGSNRRFELTSRPQRGRKCCCQSWREKGIDPIEYRVPPTRTTPS